MTTTLIPSYPGEPGLDAAEAHHRHLRAELTDRTEALLDAVGRRAPHEEAQRALVQFLREELLPHVETEENLLYRPTDPAPVDLLLRAMEEEHRMIGALVEEIARPGDPMDAVAAASALVVVTDLRMEQEDRLLLPALAEAGADLETLLGERPELVGPAARGGER